MDEHSAQRTLVKSPPELWAEISELESLARRLGEFGEIRITRLEPETTVAWEGDRACGTVRLEPTGWGTKVTLTAAVEDLPAPEPEPEPAAAPIAVEPEPEPEPEPESIAVEPQPRRGLISRLLRRRQQPIPAEPQAQLAESDPEAAPIASEPAAEEADPSSDVGAILTRVLDDLGAAHHRPFSRA